MDLCSHSHGTVRMSDRLAPIAGAVALPGPADDPGRTMVRHTAGPSRARWHPDRPTVSLTVMVVYAVGVVEAWPEYYKDGVG